MSDSLENKLRRGEGGFRLFFISALAFVLSARAGFLFAFQPSGVSPLWPPSGVCLALVVIYGYRSLWGILAGSIAVNMFNHYSSTYVISSGLIVNSLCLALANIAEYGFGCFILSKIDKSRGLLPLDLSILLRIKQPKPYSAIFAKARHRELTIKPLEMT